LDELKSANVRASKTRERLEALQRKLRDEHSFNESLAHLHEAIETCAVNLADGSLEGLQRASVQLTEILPTHVHQVESALKKLNSSDTRVPGEELKKCKQRIQQLHDQIAKKTSDHAAFNSEHQRILGELQSVRTELDSLDKNTDSKSKRDGSYGDKMKQMLKKCDEVEGVLKKLTSSCERLKESAEKLQPAQEPLHKHEHIEDQLKNETERQKVGY
jgi:chromosome segregation ATPase